MSNLQCHALGYQLQYPNNICFRTPYIIFRKTVSVCLRLITFSSRLST
jgi:hypothetical protein